MYWKNKLYVAGFLLSSFGVSSQVGINTSTPNAQLEIVSINQATPANTDGILIPKIDIFPTTNPTAAQNSMLVYLTSFASGKLPGFYYWDNATTSWKGIGGFTGWDVRGNSGTNPAINFMGTTDDTDVVFKRNLIRAGRIEHFNTSFGYNAFNPTNIGIYNAAFGDYTLSSNTSGSYNTATGTGALLSNIDGNQNTATGVNALRTNTSGAFNTALGMSALLSNTLGFQNTATGTLSMNDNTTGSNNVSNGAYSLKTNIDGHENTAIGTSSLLNNTHGNFNTAIGMSALFGNTLGVQNTSTGIYSMNDNSIGDNNVANGAYSLRYSIDGKENTAIGTTSLYSNTHGNYNTAVGMSALYSNVSGINNTAIGAYTLANGLLTGINNTAIGGGALNVTQGSNNTGLGYHAGINITTGSNNIAVGSNALIQNPNSSDQLSIANVVYGITMSTTAQGKIGIGEPAPNAKLQISASNQATPSNTDGILIPKMDAFPVTNPTAAQNSMLVYLTTAVSGKVPGFYSWDNATTSWKGISGFVGWDVNGNTGTNPAVNFIGTRDDNDIVFKRNNIRAGKIEEYNTSFGRNAFSSLNTGTYNTAIGDYALFSNTAGGSNIAIGSGAMYNNTGGGQNTAVGISAMHENTNGANNVANGDFALYNNIDGVENTALGTSSLLHNTQGNYNTAVGKEALFSNLSGINNTAVGAYALSNGLLTGINNTALGGGALNFTIGSDNTGLGYHAGINITSGSRNIVIGSNASAQNAAASDQLSVSNVLFGTTMSTTALGKIGVGEPAPNAKLQISASNQATPSNTDGILIPKIDAFPVTNPTVAQNSMLIYLTTTASGKVPGFYSWDNASTSWIAIGTKSNWTLTGNAGTNIATNFIGTTDPTDLSLKTNNTEVVRLTTTGKVGIGTPSPGAELEVNGYTKLGSNAPAIKYLKLTGTTNVAQGGTANFAHGINSAKILAVSVLVDFAAGSSVPPSYKANVGYEYDFYTTSTDVVVWNKSANSANIVSKPIRILITYEQ